MADELPELENECFFIAPIGADGSDTRKRSDRVMKHIVAVAAAEVDLATIRADSIAKPGEITRQVIEHVVGAKAAVVDLTGANPNVYYEMAVRHTARLPTVLIAEEGEVLPFDISQMRTIFFDHTDLESAAECREHIVSHLKEALNGEVDSPITASVAVGRLEQGNEQERALAQIVEGIDDLARRLDRLDRRETEQMAHLLTAAELTQLGQASLLRADEYRPPNPVSTRLWDMIRGEQAAAVQARKAAIRKELAALRGPDEAAATQAASQALEEAEAAGAEAAAIEAAEAAAAAEAAEAEDSAIEAARAAEDVRNDEPSK